MKISSIALAQVDPEDPRSPNVAVIAQSSGDALQAYKDNNQKVTNDKFQLIYTKHDGNLRIFKQNQNMMCVLIPTNSLITDTSLDSVYSSLIQKMKTSGFWVGQPVPETNAAKKFKNEMVKFATDQSYLVREDKVAVSQQKANEAKAIAAKGLSKLVENNTEIEEELLPSAIEIALAGKEEEIIAN